MRRAQCPLEPVGGAETLRRLFCGYAAGRGGSTMLQMQNKLLSNACFVLGFASIIASIAIWMVAKTPDPARGERFGIFVGLWAPTFFILSGRFAKPAVG
jgi:hypothetical protein